MLLEVHVFSLQIFFANETTEVEGKGVSSKLMVMVGVYMCYKVLICRIQVIKQTYVTIHLCDQEPSNTHKLRGHTFMTSP